MAIGTRQSPWGPRILLAVAAIISILVLMRGLSKKTAYYDAVETRGVELNRLPSARDQLDVGQEDQVSSLDLLPKVTLREADPQAPQPPAPPPPPPVQQPEPTPVVVLQPEPAPPQKKEFYRPPLQRRGLPKERTSNASTGAFLQAAPEAAKQGTTSSGSSSGGDTAAPARPRTFRDRTGKSTIRN